MAVEEVVSVRELAVRGMAARGVAMGRLTATVF
jgi:hypothetical protein